jgi:pimeloyl-ACP methyl ester carboxylesterase
MSQTRVRGVISRGDDRPTPADDVEDVVVLIPGFLGFDRFGGFFYFADRVCGALRGALEAKLGRYGRVPVIPVTSRPTASLKDCQDALIRFLSKVLAHYPNADLHLVGHSTGGVHAQLLTSARPQTKGKGSWSEDAVKCRERIRSIVSIAAPYWGTCLAYSDLASLARLDLGLKLLTTGRPIWDLIRLTMTEGALSALDLTPATAMELWRFFLEVRNNRRLIDALMPVAMTDVRRADSSAGERLPVRLRSFVTVARKNAHADPFFRDLYERTEMIDAGVRSPIADRVAHNIDLALNGPELSPGCRVIRGLSDAELRVTKASNDGVVNSAHQLLDPDSKEELAGIVVADHADVIGHYDRWELRAGAGGRSIAWSQFKRGLFRSGSNFRDEQFFELYAAVAEELLRVIKPELARSDKPHGDRPPVSSSTFPPPADA